MAASRREFKSGAADATAKTTHEKTAEGHPGQEGPRHTENRGSPYTTRSHKSISRLPDSPPRMDSRQQMYRRLDAWAGQDHV